MVFIVESAKHNRRIHVIGTLAMHFACRTCKKIAAALHQSRDVRGWRRRPTKEQEERFRDVVSLDQLGGRNMAECSVAPALQRATAAASGEILSFAGRKGALQGCFRRNRAYATSS